MIYNYKSGSIARSAARPRSVRLSAPPASAVASLREALAPYADGVSVRVRGAMWLINSAPA
jgi:hypothetical protein